MEERYFCSSAPPTLTRK